MKIFFLLSITNGYNRCREIIAQSWFELMQYEWHELEQHIPFCEKLMSSQDYLSDFQYENYEEGSAEYADQDTENWGVIKFWIYDKIFKNK